MENPKRNKRRKEKDCETVNRITEKYSNINHSNLTEEDLEKVGNYYLYRIEQASKVRESEDLDEIAELAEESLKTNLNLELEFFSIQSRHLLLETECKKLKDLNTELNKKVNDKDKYSKMLIDKINFTNQEKNKIIGEESEKRNSLVKETESFVRSLQPKYEEELKEKMKLIEENQALRSEVEQCIHNSSGLKTVLESQLKEKDKESVSMENKLKNDLKTKMETMSIEAQNFIIENSDLKIQISNYTKKCEEMKSIVDSFSVEYNKLKNEVEKKKQDIILLSAENYELHNSLKTSKVNKQVLEPILRESEKLNNQIAAMKKFNKKLTDQYEEISKLQTVKNGTQADEA